MRRSVDDHGWTRKCDHVYLPIHVSAYTLSLNNLREVPYGFYINLKQINPQYDEGYVN